MSVVEEPTAAERLTPEELPRLALFLSRHLEEGSEGARGSVAAAAYAFAEEAELDELEELARDWEVLRAAAGSLGLAETNRRLARSFGGLWRISSAAELDAVAAEFERALRE